MEAKRMDLGNDNLLKLLFKFSLPCVLAFIVSALYNLADQIFIGNSELSALGNAATGVVFPFFVITQAFAWCFGDGSAAYLSFLLGRKEGYKAKKAIGSSISLTFIFGIILAVISIVFSNDLLKLFGASENNIEYATTYLKTVAVFFPFYMLSNAMNSMIRADNSPSFAMIASLAGAVVNLVLDPLFIYAFKMGMFGAALATGLGQLISFIMCFIYLLKPKNFKLDLKSFIPSFKSSFEIVRLGMSTFITQITIVVLVVISNLTLVKYGALSSYGKDIPIAIMAVENKIFTLVINLIVGIVLGSQPLVSFNYGAKNYSRLKQIFRYYIYAVLIIGVIFTLLFELCPDALIRIFGEPKNVENPELYWEFGEKVLRIFLSLILLTLFNKMCAIFLQAANKPLLATIVSLSRDILVMIPLTLILPIFMGIEGVLFAAPIADIIAFIATIIILIIFFKNINKEEKSLKKMN